MRKLFYYLLKKYSKTEKDRLKILSKLDDEIHNDYYEQTYPGNVYNFFIEFVMSNTFIRKTLRKGDLKTLEMIKTGIDDSFDEAIEWLKKDEFIINLNTFHINEKTYNSVIDFLHLLPEEFKKKIEDFSEDINGNVGITWKKGNDIFFIDLYNNTCSYYFKINNKVIIKMKKEKIDNNIIVNLKNFYNKNRYSKLIKIIDSDD